MYYLRDRVGKAAKTKEKIGARIENREIIIKEDITEETAPEEAPAVETEKPIVEETVETIKEDKKD